MALETTVKGIKYPREIEPPESTPPGWKCVEQLYHTGSCAGQTYVRFTSPDGKKGILSVKAAIKMDADSKGLDGDKMAAEYDEAKKRKQKERVELRESMKDQALQRFIEVFGNIDGNTLQNWSGWTAQAKLIPSGQLQTCYIGPDKSRHGTIKAAQTWLGHRMLEGEDLASEFKEAVAKASVITSGNQARAALRNELNAAGIGLDKGLMMTLSKEGSLTSCEALPAGAPPEETPAQDAPPRKRRRPAETPAQDASSRRRRRPAAAGDYHESASLVVVAADALSDRGWPAIAEQAAKLRTLLVARGFADGVALVAVAREQGEELGVAEVVCGNYYRLPCDHHGRPCFKMLARAPGSAGVVCRELYISWSKARSCWKIGALDDGKVGFAFLASDLSSPTEAPSGEGAAPRWSVLTGAAPAKAT